MNIHVPFNNRPSYPIVLTIAGTDPSGGAGIQADIKTISALNGYAASVITALVAQNTQGVQDIYPIDAPFIEAQCHSVFTDLAVKSVKIGMLHDIETINCVANILKIYQPEHIVLDPVMVATSGDALLNRNAINTLVNELFPLATIITPNLPEAAFLLDTTIDALLDNIDEALDKLGKLGANAVLLKGGHDDTNPLAIDYLAYNQNVETFTLPRINTRNNHGTGCALSSAIATYLSQGEPLNIAVKKAKQYVHDALNHSNQLAVGLGRGPLHHFYKNELQGGNR